jgi:murein DD-endopeptidase MepM/ murein hydrolase activator NlpD
MSRFAGRAAGAQRVSGPGRGALGLAFCLLAQLLLRSASAQTSASSYPSLGSLGPDDLIFRQHQEQLAASYAALRSGKAVPDLVVYSYRVVKTVDLFSLAARLNLPYETLATFNHLDRVREFLPGERVLAPSMPGLFVPETPGSDLDFLLSYRGTAESSLLAAPGAASAALSPGSSAGPGGQKLRFYPGARFTSEERALFLGLLFRFPLPMGRLTSGFGLRESPISHHMAKHQGIDLAAPTGTDVYAARDGTVSETGVDPVLGQYIILVHEGGWSTVYGHLSARRVRLNDRIESGMIIGNVGSTGQSTGPHLHFEVRNRGEPRNPEPLIPKGNR